MELRGHHAVAPPVLQPATATAALPPLPRYLTPPAMPHSWLYAACLPLLPMPVTDLYFSASTVCASATILGCHATTSYLGHAWLQV